MRPLSLLKSSLYAVLGPYELYRIYQADPSRPGRPPSTADAVAFESLGSDGRRIAGAPDPAIARLAARGGEEAFGYAAFLRAEPVAAVWFWAGDRYRRERGFWPLGRTDAQLVQVTTAANARGRGIASALIAYASADMTARGYERLFARIWWSNTPSVRAFKRAGWRQVAFVATVRPPWLGCTLRCERPRRGAASRANGARAA